MFDGKLIERRASMKNRREFFEVMTPVRIDKCFLANFVITFETFNIINRLKLMRFGYENVLTFF